MRSHCHHAARKLVYTFALVQDQYARSLFSIRPTSKLGVNMQNNIRIALLGLGEVRQTFA